jgi:hypothetical protein
MKRLPPSYIVARDLAYNPETGEFHWKRSYHGRQAGAVAGTITRGRRMIGICDDVFYASRLAHLLMTGRDPESMEMDHINGNTLDDRWSNLRAVTRSQNLMNRRPFSKGEASPYFTGHKCVYKRAGKRGDVYFVVLSIEGRSHYKGTFKNIEDAIALVEQHYEDSGLCYFQPPKVQAQVEVDA